MRYLAPPRPVPPRPASSVLTSLLHPLGGSFFFFFLSLLLFRQQMEYFSSNPNADSINKVKSEIAEVKNVMVENIEKVLDRGEKIELLMDKTDRLQGEASRFRGQARKLKNQMWWNKIRNMMLLALIIFLVIYFILALACGPKLKCSG